MTAEPANTMTTTDRSFFSRFAKLFFSPRFAFFVILLIAVVSRAWAVSEPRLRSDSCEYLDLAREMASGEYFRAEYPLSQGILWSRRLTPLYSLLTAGIHLTGLPLLASGYAVSLLADLLAVALAFRIGRRAAGLKGAWMAGLIAASSLHHLAWSTEVLTESLFGLCLLLTLDSVIVAGQSPNIVQGIKIGAFAALAYLTREIGLALVGVLAVTGLLWYLLPGRPPSKKFLSVALSALLAFLVISFPFWLNIRARTGSFGLSMRGEVAKTIAIEKGQQPWEKPEALPAPAGREILQGLATRLRLADDYLAVSLPTGPSSWLKWIGFGWLVIFGAGKRRLSWLIAGWAALLFLANLAVGPPKVVSRYIYASWIMFELAAALAWTALPGWAGKILFRGRPRAGQWLTGTLIALAALVWLSDAFLGCTFMRAARRMSGPFYFSQGIEAITDEIRNRDYPLPTHPRVMDRKPYSAYYLGGTMVMLPETIAEVNRITAAGGVDLVIIDSVMIRHMRPGLAPLISGLNPPAGMRVLFQRHVPELVKIYTVYAPDDGPGPESILPASMVGLARNLNSGDLWTARTIGEALLIQDPNNFDAHIKMAFLEMIIASVDGISLPRAEAEVQTLERLAPADPAAKQARANLENIRRQLQKQSATPAAEPPENEDVIRNPR